jgi:hypothetical protein
VTTFTVALDFVRRLDCLQLLLDQVHNNNTEFHGVAGRVGGWCSPGHYVVTPTRVEVELRCNNYPREAIENVKQNK